MHHMTDAALVAAVGVSLAGLTLLIVELAL